MIISNCIIIDDGESSNQCVKKKTLITDKETNKKRTIEPVP